MTSHVPRGRAWAAGAALLVIAACGGQPASVPASAGTTPTTEPSVSASPPPSAGPPSVADLSRAVVQVFAEVDGELLPFGSGTLISADGRILTNAHVAEPLDVELDGLAVGLTEDAGTAPEPMYRAEVLAVDQIVDLAIIQISETLDGDPVDDTFPFLPLGDSDAINIGDEVLILGYPSIGGDTITFTRGQVSGFTSEAVVGDRAWIKTDATIAGGNSGGLAADIEGRLIGVPTQAAVGDEVVDCRPVRDTNRDFVIDDDDDCVPIGGFLNGLRPAALAEPLIAAVESGIAYEPIGGPDAHTDPGTFQTEGISFTATPVMTTDVTDDDTPVDEVEWLAAGEPQLCALWEFEGMEDGMLWSVLWAVDGTVVEEYSVVDEIWGLGAAGTFWVCATNEDGLQDGVYDLSLTVEDEFQSGGFAFVGHDLEPQPVTVRNDYGDTICFLFIAPTLAGSWGADRLGATEVFPSGETIERDLPLTTYDTLGADCDSNELFDVRGVEIDPDGILPVGG